MHRFLLLACVLALASCTSAEATVKQEIAKANYCETANDCVLVGSKCPFDCYIYANAKESDRIKSLVENYGSTCEYSCLQSFGVECKEHKCMPMTEQPISPEGNVGAACATDAECQTPMSYLTRSSCPFTSMCIQGACAVVCPMMTQDINPNVSQSHTISCTQDADCSCNEFAVGNSGTCNCVNGSCVAIM